MIQKSYKINVKVNKAFNDNLRRLSFSETDLLYLKRPIMQKKDNFFTKKKYWECFEKSILLTNKNKNETKFKNLIQSDPEIYLTCLLSKLENETLVEQQFYLKRIFSFYKFLCFSKKINCYESLFNKNFTLVSKLEEPYDFKVLKKIEKKNKVFEDVNLETKKENLEKENLKKENLKEEYLENGFKTLGLLKYNINEVSSNENKLKINNSSEELDNLITIDLNDVKNFEVFKENLSNDLETALNDEETIKLEFDKKFKSFLLKDICNLKKTKKNSFDSKKCFKNFNSKIPILIRDENKFDKKLINKLKVTFDPFNLRKNKINFSEFGLVKKKSSVDKMNYKFQNFKNSSKDLSIQENLKTDINSSKENFNKKIDHLLINKKDIKNDKFYNIIKELGMLKNFKDKEFQTLKKSTSRTKSECFINETLNSNRLNENYRQKLLKHEIKNKGNCLLDLYDFDDYKNKLLINK